MISRRTFLGSSAALGAAAAGGSLGLPTAATAATPSRLPAPGRSGIDHIVVVMMENRSYDHFLGWLPNSNGRQAGLRYQGRYGGWHRTYHLNTPGPTCNNTDPDHSWEGGREELNFGRCDGWLKAGQNDLLAIGYYTAPDLGFFGKAAPYWTTCDRYFSAIMAETYPNRFYQHAAQTDRLHNSSDRATMTTIWDRCKAKGVRANYYYSDVPFTALWYDKYLLDGTSQPITSFYTAAATGTLPSVSFVDPSFAGEGNGTSGDDHPSADIRKGQEFLSRIYTALTKSPQWKNTLLVINYDEWGGFFDHVAPNRAPDAHPRCALRGFRVPAMLIGPRARRRFVAPWAYDHASVLKMIEWRFGLAPLTRRDAGVRNIAEALNFSAPPNLNAPPISYTAPPSAGCVPSAPGRSTPVQTKSSENEWLQLLEVAKKEGFQIP